MVVGLVVVVVDGKELDMGEAVAFVLVQPSIARKRPAFAQFERLDHHLVEVPRGAQAFAVMSDSVRQIDPISTYSYSYSFS